MYSAIVHDQDNLHRICVYYSKFLHGIRAVDHQIYYSESVYNLFLQAESVIGPGSLWIHPSFGR